MPKQLSSISSSWQNPLSGIQASSNARVNVLLSSINSLSSSSTRLFTKLLQKEVENQKMDQDLQRSSINSSSRYVTPPRNSVIRGDDLSHRRSLPLATSASASASTVVPNFPDPHNHQFSRASISTSSHLIGGPFRVARDVCVKFNSVDARFEGAPASEEWAVLHQQFGIPLAQTRCRSSNSGDQVPALLHMLRRELLKRDGLTTKYIYRASSEQKEVQGVKKAINSGSVEHSHVSDPHVYASLIKQWLRELPSLLLSKLSIDDFTSKSDDVTQVLSKLSPQERAVLEWLLDHMLEVVEESAVNKMTAQSFAVVMAPNLFNCESVSKTLAGVSSAANSVAEFLCALLTWRQTIVGGGGSTSSLDRSLLFAARRSVVGESQTSDAPIQGTSSIRSRTSSVENSMPIEPRSLESVDEQSHLLSDTDQSLEKLIKLAVDSVWNELEAQGIDSVEMLLTDKHVRNQRFEKYQRSILELIAKFSKRNGDRDWAGAVRVKLENGISVQNVAIPSSLGGVKCWVKAALSVDDFLHQLRSEKNIREKLERFRTRFPVDCGMRRSSSSDGGARILDSDKTHDLFHQIFLASLDETDSTTCGRREPAEEDNKHAGQGADSDLREGALRLLRFNTNANDSQSELVLRAEEIAKCGTREPTIGNLLAGLSQSASFSHLHLEESQEQLTSMVQSTLKAHQLLQY